MADEAIPAQNVSFHDYHRTIIGYHGTTAAIAERLVNGEPFKVSQNGWRDNSAEWESAQEAGLRHL